MYLYIYMYVSYLYVAKLVMFHIHIRIYKMYTSILSILLRITFISSPAPEPGLAASGLLDRQPHVAGEPGIDGHRPER